MTTMVHVTAVPYEGTGMVMLRVDTSGDPAPGDIVTLGRRPVGSTAASPAIVPAGYLATSGDVRLINGSGLFYDTTIPLDTPVEYLSGLPGGTATVAAGPITLGSQSTWRLGDPLRPYLDMAMVLTRSTATACPVAPNAIITSLTDDSLSGQSESVAVPGSGYPLTNPEPISSPTFGIAFVTKTTADREAAESLFAPGGILLLRAPSAYALPSRYLRVDSVGIARVRSDHRFPWRRFDAQVREEEQPTGAAYGWLGACWADLCSGSYPTWSAVTAAGLSWSSLATGIASGAYPSVMRTYPEVAATWATYADLEATGKTYAQLAAGA